MLPRLSFFLALAAGDLGVHALAAPPIAARGSTPKYPYDPNTTKYCSYWIDNAGAATKCTDIPKNWGITLADFLRWNPSLAPDCTNFEVQKSYCVETTDEPAPTTSSDSSTPTQPSNGITTPQPIQPGMVDNCDAFYFVPKDVGCQVIATSHGITLEQFLTWNPLIGDTCGGLWANAYVCVSIIGHEPSPVTTATPTPTSTNPGNGITTPQPTQPDIVDNCDKFYFVQKDESCDVVAAKNGITTAQFQAWNKAVGSTCSGLWANAYACVSIIGHEPATTTTKKPTTTAGNGITTPTPTQSGMVGNCRKFHFVQRDQTCATIAKQYGISEADFIKWNPAVGGTSCGGLWANTYACVGL
ncbi:LysM domain-containing protein [Xylaria bambusicola]|uniref:LysM domain-containing protein n=1 Tax=Xylaria bambusicola TaxID=326684 RepID=UPI0020089102|nr:LysM domain-containing protein [Xylaria bambusicola]KAI0505413.1 LysM domain-containing protein [Xylaria bambusicola]